MPRSRIGAIVATVIIATVATLATRSLAAQQVRIMALRAQTTHALLPRSGGVAGAWTAPISPRVGYSALVEYMAGDGSGIGVVCAGLVNPEDCPTEPFDQRCTLFSFGLGADLAVWRNRYVHVAALPHLLVARVRSTVRGAITGNVLSAEENEIGISGALEARLTPSVKAPLAIVVGAATRRYGPARKEIIDDGYTPFEGGYTVRTLYAGAAVSWTLRRNAPR